MSSQYHSEQWANRAADNAFPPNQPPMYGQGAWQRQPPADYPGPPQVAPGQQTYLNNNIAPKGQFNPGPAPTPPQGQPSWQRVPPQQSAFQPQATTNPYQTNSYSYPSQPHAPIQSAPPNVTYNQQPYFAPQDGYQQPGHYPSPNLADSFSQQPTYPNNFPLNLHATPPPNAATPPVHHLQQQPALRPTPPPQNVAPTPPLQTQYQATAKPFPMQAAPPSTDDSWGWGWEESSSDSTPATSTPNNNWGSQTPAGLPPPAAAFASAQNYFTPPRPGTGTPMSEISQESRATPNSLEATRAVPTGATSAPSATQMPEVQSSPQPSVSNDVKKERASPEPRASVTMTPLTTQALREFYKEGYANGPSSHRLGAEVLTPQWSIESQMSQETASDDASHSMAGTSDADPSNAWHEEPVHNHYDRYPTEELILPNTTSNTVSVRGDVYRPSEVTTMMSSLSLEQDAGNKEVISPEQYARNAAPLAPLSGDDLYASPAAVKDIPSEVNRPTTSGPPPAVNKRNTEHAPPPPALTDTAHQPLNAAHMRLHEPPQWGRGAFSEPPRNSAVIGSMDYQAQFAQVPIQRLDQVDQMPRQDMYARNEDNTLSLEGGTVELAAAGPGESVNLETVPENKERPDLDLRARNQPLPPPQQSVWHGVPAPDNHEVSPHSERDQYLETEQLTDQGENQYMDRGDLLSLSEMMGEADQPEGLPPPGLSRLVTGEGHNIDVGNDISAPPAGLDRMVLGQITDRHSSPVIAAQHCTPPPPPAGLHRMVLGQVTDEPSVVPSEPRLVPGESSSPEAPPVVTSRVVPGVGSEDATVPSLSLPVSPGIRRQSLNECAEQSVRSQPQAERSETIGSESVTADPSDSSSKPSKRREKEYLREDISSDEREGSGRGGRDGDYYRERERGRDRNESPAGDRRRVDYGRRRRHSPQRYRDYRADDRRRRRDYDYSDEEDADTVGYSSDRADRDRRNMSYREDYDRGTYPRRDDRARSLKPDKSRDRPDDRKEKDKRRGYDKERDRDSRQGDYYRRRDDPEDYREQRSRPSSRNDTSVHDFKQRGGRDERDADREHYKIQSKRERDAYYQQAQYGYDPAMYYYYQQYYENLRRTNPAAYTEYYRKYYASSQQGTYSEDRASVHSGRSSADDTKDRAYKKLVFDTSADTNHHMYRVPHNNLPSGPRAKVESSPGRGRHSMKCRSLPLDHHSYIPSLNFTSTPDSRPPWFLQRSLDTSVVQEEAMEPQRLTPAKFSAAHAKGLLTARGQLITILPHYPQDGQPATVQLCQQLPCLQPARALLQDFPGPLLKNVTHKKSVMDYCEQKILEADNNPDLYDKDSYKLIWEFFHLLLRQNGQVVGTDIAELLMNPSRRSDPLPAPSPATSHHSLNELTATQEDDLTNKYRNLLIYGNTKAALEWAMKHGLWGHALFLASKMDQRTYASVMTRFANGLSLNDPLQTLYQLMSGRQPAAVTCCFDEKWGDWRPHLAMILSNSSGREDVKNRAIATLGDTLASRGALYAAHFCYMLAQIEFGSYGHKSSKLVLITASHALPFHRFATNEAIFATEIFEYALSLAGEFVLPHFQVYKLLMAQRLAEVGLSQEAVHYTEVIATTITKQPALYPPTLIQQVYDLGDMLKLSDPIYSSTDCSGSDPLWLQHLYRVLNDYQTGALQHQTALAGSISNLTTISETEGQPSLPVDMPDQAWHNDSMYHQQAPQQQAYPQQHQPWSQDHDHHSLITQSDSSQDHQQQQQVQPQPEANFGGSPNYWTPPPPQQQTQWAQPADLEPIMSPSTPALSTPDYYEPNRSEATPTITLPGASTGRVRTSSQSSDSIQSFSSPRKQSHDVPKNAQQQQQQQQQGSGWFGGLFSKLSLRPKNQMILPDDKNPSIVWDADKKRWVNQNEDEDEGPGSLPPPPMMGAPRPGGPSPPSVAAPASASNASASLPPVPPSSGANLYKMPRGKNLRANYVDVMNPGGKTPQPSAVPAPDLFPSLSYSSQPNLFVPPPVEGQEGGLNLFTPNLTAPSDQQESRDAPAQGLSRWSSASSLSREVQTITARRSSRFSSFTQDVTHNGHKWNNGSIGGTLPRTKRPYI